MSTQGSNITVSEEKLQLHLANFKLDLFKELTTTYATREQFKDLTQEFKAWRQEFEPRLKAVEDRQTETGAESATKRRLANGAWALAVAVVSALIYIAGSLH